jgi:tRNA (guanine37-N1)-methyltransferase
MLRITVITLFPELFPGPLQASLVGKALEKKRWDLTVVSLRDYGEGAYGAVDAPCYGGGAGMVIRPDVVDRALEEIMAQAPEKRPCFLYMTPRGAPLKQAHLHTWAAQKHLVILSGRYEGVDQRVLEHWGFQEVSLGDFVLCGGDLPAMVLIEGCVRLLPDVLGNAESLVHESFENNPCLLEHPLYTRPRVWKNQCVPEVLLSGHHARIAHWKACQSYEDTLQRRPDLTQKTEKSD